MADLHLLSRPVNKGEDFNGGPLHSGSEEPQGVDLRLVFFREDLVLLLLQIQHGFSTIFLYHFSCSLRAVNLANMLSSCLEDPGWGLWLDLKSCLPNPRWERLEPLSTVPERSLLWVSARCQEPSRRSRSSYLLQAASPRPSSSSGSGNFRRTDFTTDFNFGVDARVSGLLAG